MSCSDEPGLTRGVAERVAHLRHKARQIRLRDESGRPETLVQFLFRECTRAANDEQRKEVEGLGRQVDFDAGPVQLPCLRIERQLAQPKFHSPPIVNPGIAQESPRTVARPDSILVAGGPP